LSVGRLRGGELLAGVGAVVLLVSLFLDWFDVPPSAMEAQIRRTGVDQIDVSLPRDVWAASGWDALGWPVLAVAAAAIALGVWLVFATATVRPVTQVVAADVLTATIGTLALVVLALRALIFQPGPNELTTIRYGAWIGLVGAAALAVGAWWSLADERTDAPESAYVPPAPRPAPPAHSS
jgi:FtsH-binding integral membrane protein